MDIHYPRDADPFEVGGRERARRFAHKFADRNFYEQCCVISEADSNIYFDKDRDYFADLISIGRDTPMFEMMRAIGDRSFAYHSDMMQISYWLKPICLGLVDDVDEIVLISQHMSEGRNEEVLRLLAELRHKRSA